VFPHIAIREGSLTQYEVNRIEREQANSRLQQASVYSSRCYEMLCALPDICLPYKTPGLYQPFMYINDIEIQTFKFHLELQLF